MVGWTTTGAQSDSLSLHLGPALLKPAKVARALAAGEPSRRHYRQVGVALAVLVRPEDEDVLVGPRQTCKARRRQLEGHLDK